jgi:uncharacterized protein (DUF924 family)
LGWAFYGFFKKQQRMIMNSKDVIDFWFEELTPKDWWTKNLALDQKIKTRFADLHAKAHREELAPWRANDMGRLAEIIVLDQFSRNMYRDDARAFASDELASRLAQEAVAVGAFDRLSQPHSPFLIMPYMHSESPEVHGLAVPLFVILENSNQLDFELRHKAIIDQFGRYPHRNGMLNRVSTKAEIEFLQQPGSSF